MKKGILGIAILALVTSCDKNDNIIEDVFMSNVDLKSTTESVVTTEAQLDDISEAADYEIELFTGTDEAIDGVLNEQANSSLKSTGIPFRFKERYKWGKCPDIHIIKAEGGWPRTITLNYGEGTELANGRIISGSIEIVQSGPRRENGSTRTVTFIGFSIDEIGIAGNSIKTFLIDEFKVEIIRDLTFTLPDGTTIDRDAERTRTWLEGMDTPLNHLDDVFEITGFVNCEDSDGNVYRRDITAPLIKKGGCRFIVAGEVSLSKNGVVFATINYGDGECDNMATMTTAEGSKTFKIGERKREKRQEQKQEGQ